ncbi:hypothetical protein PoB_001642400 [Plakobranchus ocellatus]|uniref:Uncharacterized protein n=1 Tax=Plakobranchus ocellatus TaxID=259542 RepID=A0AAV3Z7E0_9GAST|nr:hypothetical protein PoB_001642400 [Plakobranchus ocellatus]
MGPAPPVVPGSNIQKQAGLPTIGRPSHGDNGSLCTSIDNLWRAREKWRDQRELNCSHPPGAKRESRRCQHFNIEYLFDRSSSGALEPVALPRKIAEALLSLGNPASPADDTTGQVALSSPSASTQSGKSSSNSCQQVRVKFCFRVRVDRSCFGGRPCSITMAGERRREQTA